MTSTSEYNAGYLVSRAILTADGNTIDLTPEALTGKDFHHKSDTKVLNTYEQVVDTGDNRNI